MKIFDFIQKYKVARSKWDSTLNSFQRSDLGKQGVIAEMSLIDLIAHMTWYEKQMVELLSTKVFAGSDLWNLKHDERNLVIYNQNRDRGVQEVLVESEKTYKELFNELCELSDAELASPSAFKNMPDDWAPWMMIAENSYKHYQEHFDDIKNWYSILYE